MADRTLTDADVAAITDALKGHDHCNLGLTPDQATTLKRLLTALDGLANTVGKLVVTAVVLALIAVFTRGFWMSLATGVKEVGK